MRLRLRYACDMRTSVGRQSGCATTTTTTTTTRVLTLSKDTLPLPLPLIISVYAAGGGSGIWLLRPEEQVVTDQHGSRLGRRIVPDYRNHRTTEPAGPTEPLRSKCAWWFSGPVNLLHNQRCHTVPYTRHFSITSSQSRGPKHIKG